MMNQIERLEQALGGKIEQKTERVVPGLIPQEDVEVVYFSLGEKGNARKQFRNIANHTNPPIAQHGGASESGCRIQLPDGTSFYAISYHGDLAGWRKDIEEGARAFNSVLAWIAGGNLVTADGAVFEIDKCKIEFF